MGEDNIRPKSIAREMFENCASFAEYVMEYDLERSEGLLLRHLNSVYKVLSQTVPDATKTDDVLEIEWYFKSLVRGVDASLADEWERMRDPLYVPLAGSGAAIGARPPRAAKPAAYDLTGDRRAFTAAIRARIFQVLKAWSRGDGPAMNAALDLPDPGASPAGPWTPELVRATLDAYVAGHGAVRFDPEARNARHTYIAGEEGQPIWRVQQMLVDAEMVNDWVAEFEVDVEASRLTQQPALRLNRVGMLA